MTEKSGLWYRCREFVTEQSAGEWDDKTIADDADKLFEFVMSEKKKTLAVLVRACKELEEAGHPMAAATYLAYAEHS